MFFLKYLGVVCNGRGAPGQSGTKGQRGKTGQGGIKGEQGKYTHPSQ